MGAGHQMKPLSPRGNLDEQSRYIPGSTRKYWKIPNQSIANVPRRVPGAPPKRRVPGAPPVKKNIISLNNSNQQGNITIPNNIENLNANSINKNPILRKTLGSLAQRAQQPKRRVPGAPSGVLNGWGGCATRNSYRLIDYYRSTWN